jgi:hypothetical protein
MKDSARIEQMLQQVELDTTRSEEIRNLSGTLHYGHRYARVLTGHNGAQSCYSAWPSVLVGGVNWGGAAAPPSHFYWIGQSCRSGHVGFHQPEALFWRTANHRA